MCLAIPGKVLKIYIENNLKMGLVDFSGIQQTVCLECLPDIKNGQYALVHAGFAISIVDEKEALKSYELWKAVGDKTAHNLDFEN